MIQAILTHLSTTLHAIRHHGREHCANRPAAPEGEAVADDARVAQWLFDQCVDFCYRVTLTDVDEYSSIQEPACRRSPVYVTAIEGPLSDDKIELIMDLAETGRLPHLKRINVEGGTVTNLGIAALGRATELRSLRLFDGADQATDDGVREALSRLHRLESLELSLEQCTDAALQTGTVFSSLSEADVSFTQLTDCGMNDLISRAPQLKTLDVTGTLVTARGIAAARRLSRYLDIRA